MEAAETAVCTPKALLRRLLPVLRFCLPGRRRGKCPEAPKPPEPAADGECARGQGFPHRRVTTEMFSLNVMPPPNVMLADLSCAARRCFSTNALHPGMVVNLPECSEDRKKRVCFGIRCDAKVGAVVASGSPLSPPLLPFARKTCKSAHD